MIWIKYGITGNYYVTAETEAELKEVCEKLGKAPSSIRWHKKYNTWVFRIKSKKTKALLKKEYADFL